MIAVVRRVGGVLVALLVVLGTFIGLPATAPPLSAAPAHGRHDYSYRSCYFAHGYWHCENDGRDWWWYQGTGKCHQHAQWYCYGPKGHGSEHGHG
ncbi:MAG: hypothetical protein ACM4D3_03975 [Candidatus Sericytochromatia bacterium]